MRILNFGSLNIDAVYRVPHISRPGETVPSQSFQTFAGGKGANQSVALARAGADVAHAGQVGHDGRWLVDKLNQAGVDTTHTLVAEDIPTGHAIIQVDDDGQNSIVLYPGANKKIAPQQMDAALAAFDAQSLLLLQNEVNDIPYLIQQAADRGMKVCLNPAPFDPRLREYPLDKVKLIIVNQSEAAGLVGQCDDDMQMVARLTDRLPETQVVLTCGSRGVLYGFAGQQVQVPACQVKAVDTTAAGDTFIGYFLAAQAAGDPVQQSLELACRAAALCVTKPGAMDSIPTADQVGQFRP